MTNDILRSAIAVSMEQPDEEISVTIRLLERQVEVLRLVKLLQRMRKANEMGEHFQKSAGMVKNGFGLAQNASKAEEQGYGRR
jgi:hypothetical protein